MWVVSKQFICTLTEKEATQRLLSQKQALEVMISMRLRLTLVASTAIISVVYQPSIKVRQYHDTNIISIYCVSEAARPKTLQTVEFCLS